VVAYGAGGALETVAEGETGVFFRAPTAASLAEALSRFEAMTFDPAACRRRAAAFDKKAFQSAIRDFVEARFAERGKKG
jgi:glycosyltransferase involved in cell wall biosynthesis